MFSRDFGWKQGDKIRIITLNKGGKKRC